MNMNKKKFLKTLSIVAVAIISGYGGMKAYQSHANEISLLTLQGVEALADGTPEENEGLYYLHHFDCKITVSTSAEANILARFINGNAKVGATADLSPLTQYFNNISEDGEGPCEKETQITCNEAVQQILDNTK